MSSSLIQTTGKNGLIRILIAVDRSLLRHGLRSLLQAESDLRVVGEAGDGGEAVKLVRELKPDILFLEFTGQQVSGPEVLQKIANSHATLRTIVLTDGAKRQEIVEALQLGARGVVPNDASTETIIKSIRVVMAGEYWITREQVSDLMAVLRGRQADSDGRLTHINRRLTPRESEIVSAIVAGGANKDIAQRFSLSKDTVKHHLTNIFDKLGVSNRLELGMLAIERGLVSNSIATTRKPRDIGAGKMRSS